MTRAPWLFLIFAASACGDDAPVANKAPTPAASASAKASPAPKGKAAQDAAKAASGAAGSAEPGPPKVEFQETDFAETDRSRDPFRSFANIFVEQAKSKVRSQLQIVAKQYSVDELKLVGTVTRIHPPRAMFVDPTGKGHVIDRGDFIGKAEIVQGGATAADYEIHWRVDRVRDSDVVLVREDPANPDVPSATRVIPLRPEDALNER